MEKQTADTIDDEGYLHSGDVSEFDTDTKSIANGDREDLVGPSGFMKITGRIKELIITGTYIHTHTLDTILDYTISYTLTHILVYLYRLSYKPILILILIHTYTPPLHQPVVRTSPPS